MEQKLFHPKKTFCAYLEHIFCAMCTQMTRNQKKITFGKDFRIFRSGDRSMAPALFSVKLELPREHDFLKNHLEETLMFHSTPVFLCSLLTVHSSPVILNDACAFNTIDV